jgi:uncharacterized protein
VIQQALVLNVAFTPASGAFPVILPMVGAMGSFTHPSVSLDEPLDVYVHGYVSNRMARLARGGTASDGHSNNDESGRNETHDGIPVCVSATQAHGLVLSLTPYSHDLNYSSAVLFGHAAVVTDEAEKLYAMELITNKIVAGRWNPEHTRVPPTKAEMSSTSILKIVVQSGSAKVRRGGPKDEGPDLGDAPLRQRTWTGVVPVLETLGEPVADALNQVSEVPAYLRDYVDKKTTQSRARAEEFLA